MSRYPPQLSDAILAARAVYQPRKDFEPQRSQPEPYQHQIAVRPRSQTPRTHALLRRPRMVYKQQEVYKDNVSKDTEFDSQTSHSKGVSRRPEVYQQPVNYYQSETYPQPEIFHRAEINPRRLWKGKSPQAHVLLPAKELRQGEIDQQIEDYNPQVEAELEPHAYTTDIVEETAPEALIGRRENDEPQEDFEFSDPTESGSQPQPSNPERLFGPQSETASGRSNDHHSQDVDDLTSQMQASFRHGITPRPSDVFIAVMGVTGAGKSTFISKCSDKPIGIGDSLQAHTIEVDEFPCQLNETTTVYLIDTPGFDDTNRSDTQVLREIATWLTVSYSANIRLSGIIYLHRISDARMSGSAKKNLFMFRKLCGPHALKNVILATTMWNSVSERQGAARERELRSTSDFWGWMVEQGSQIRRHDGSTASAMSLIRDLVKNNEKVTLSLQHQMVTEKKGLDDTDAGQEVRREIIKERERMEKNLADIRMQQKEALELRDQESARELAKVKREFEQRILETERNEQNLRTTSEQLIKARYASLEARIQEQQTRVAYPQSTRERIVRSASRCMSRVLLVDPNKSLPFSGR